MVDFLRSRTPARCVPLKTYASEARCGKKRGIRWKKGSRNSQAVHRIAPGSRRMFTPAMPITSCKYIPHKDAKGLAPLVAMGIESTNDSVLGRDYSDDSDDPPFCCLAQPPVWSRLLLRVNDHFAFCLGHSSIQNVSVFQIPIVELHTRSHDPL